MELVGRLRTSPGGRSELQFLFLLGLDVGLGSSQHGRGNPEWGAGDLENRESEGGGRGRERGSEVRREKKRKGEAWLAYVVHSNLIEEVNGSGVVGVSAVDSQGDIVPIGFPERGEG
jgi:hypothetical protein